MADPDRSGAPTQNLLAQPDKIREPALGKNQLEAFSKLGEVRYRIIRVSNQGSSSYGRADTYEELPSGVS